LLDESAASFQELGSNRFNGIEAELQSPDYKVVASTNMEDNANLAPGIIMLSPSSEATIEESDSDPSRLVRLLYYSSG
jgi:hypothetical protein